MVVRFDAVELAPVKVDRFQIERELGRGASSVVYRAFDPKLQRAVAIKLLVTATKPAGFDERQTIDLREPSAHTIAEDALVEARVMARLSHPNVLPVFEVGVVAEGVFFVLELIDGKNLRDWLDERSPAYDEVASVLAQAARGLAAAHAADVVHRDFKPDNVLVGVDGRVRVADFGLSSLFVKPDARSMTRVGGAVGTPRYMAPELWQGVPASQQSDVYALALTCAEAFANGVAADELPPALASVDDHVRAVIVAGLSREPRDRPSVEAFVAALEGRAPRRRRLVWIAAGALGAAVGVTAAFAMGSDARTCEPAQLDWWRGGNALAGALQARGIVDPSEHVRFAERAIAAAEAMRGEACGDDARVRCLDRRLLELHARIDRALDPEVSAEEIPFALTPTSLDIASCATVHGDASPLDAELYSELPRYLGAFPTLTSRLPELEKFAARAEAAGNPELAAIALRRRAGYDVWLGDAAAADEQFAKAQRLAETARASGLANLILSDRANAAIQRDDLRGARSLIKLAFERSDRDPAAIRFRVLYVATSVADLQADRPAALAYSRDALAVFPSDVPVVLRKDVVTIERLRAHGLEATNALAEAKATIRRAVDHARGWQLGDAVLRSTLIDASVVHAEAGDLDAERAFSDAVVDLIKRHPASEPELLAIDHYDLGMVAIRRGDLEEARGELVAALDRPPPETLHRVEGALARCLNELHRYDDARVYYDRALAYALERYGQHDPRTSSLMQDAALNDYARKDIAHARELADTVARELAARSDRLAMVSLDGDLRAQLALDAHRFSEAEQLVRGAIDTLHELGRAGEAGHYVTLANVLLAEKRFADARDAAAFGLDAERNHLLATKRQLALLEAALAQAEAGLRGHPSRSSPPSSVARKR